MDRRRVDMWMPGQRVYAELPANPKIQEVSRGIAVPCIAFAMQGQIQSFKREGKGNWRRKDKAPAEMPRL
jgi:hypothetical protein